MTNRNLPSFEKCPTGISGFDDISGGGLPRGRPTLVSGYAGTGKSMFALEVIVHGIEKFGDAGIFVSFEESPADLVANVSSLGYDLVRYQSDGLLRIIPIRIDAGSLLEVGEYDLEGLFLRLGTAIDAIDAKRIALDGIETLFSAFSDLRILRSEFRRLLQWLKDRGLTAIITTERGKEALSRHGLEEYIADCVIALDHRIDSQIATRRLRIVKYRGSAHGSDEFPFVLDQDGFSVLPITSAGLTYSVSTERISSGIASLDEMLGGGYFRGSSLLVSGTSGTGKSSIAASMVQAACDRGERCLYLAMEESPEQIERNMRSIGLDLAPWRAKGMLHIHATRSTSNGLESHLTSLVRLVRKFDPQLVVIDPISSFDSGVSDESVKLMLVRAVDLLKSKSITSLFTCLTSGSAAEETTAVGISSLVDVWLLLRNLESAGERTRGLYVCKARGTAHSNQIREFILTDSGVSLEPVVLDEAGKILTGSARIFSQEGQRARNDAHRAASEKRRAALEQRRNALEARIAAMRSEFDCELDALETELHREALQLESENTLLSSLAGQRNGALNPPRL